MHIPSFEILLSSTFVVAFVCGASAQGSKSPETYEPPAASKVVLGNIVPTLKNAKPVDISQFEKRPPKVALALPGGQLYFEVPSIDIDDDGSNAGSPQ